MEFFKKVTDIDFMQQKNHALIFSAALFILSIIAIASQGLSLGLDFTGGTQYEFELHEESSIEAVRTQLRLSGYEDAQVQSAGGQSKALVRIGKESQTTDPQQQKADISRALAAVATLEKNEFIGAQVGQELLLSGVAAVIISVLFTMIYIMVRFEYRFAISAALALVHDPIVILGIFRPFKLNLTHRLAALLTVLGYSLNDTIVVYDRIRENIRHDKKSPIATIVNHAINQTLSRTIITSGLTLMVVIALYIWGGESLEGFSLALIIGIIIGTYSSIYIAGAFAVILGLDREAFHIN